MQKFMINLTSQSLWLIRVGGAKRIVHSIAVSLHGNKCNVRLPYVKHAFNVRYKTEDKHTDRAPYV